MLLQNMINIIRINNKDGGKNKEKTLFPFFTLYKKFTKAGYHIFDPKKTFNISQNAFF